MVLFVWFPQSLRQGGIDVKIEDVDEYPYNLWGRAQRTLAGWNLSARLEASSKNLQAVAFNLLAENELRSTALQVQGLTDTAQKSGAVQKLTLSQKLLGETLTLVPTYDFSTKEAEVGVTYSGFPNTIVNIDTSTKGPQMITVSQRIGEDNQIIPSVSSAGDLEIEYRRAIEGGTIAVNLKPKESVTLKWNDGPWLATLMAPMTGPYSFSRDINVGFKRSVQVF